MRKRSFEANSILYCRTSTAKVVIKLPVNGISGMVLGGPERNILYAIAESAIINLNTLENERISQKSHIYEIVGIDAIGKKTKRANV